MSFIEKHNETNDVGADHFMTHTHDLKRVMLVLHTHYWWGFVPNSARQQPWGRQSSLEAQVRLRMLSLLVESTTSRTTPNCDVHSIWNRTFMHKSENWMKYSLLMWSMFVLKTKEKLFLLSKGTRFKNTHFSNAGPVSSFLCSLENFALESPCIQNKLFRYYIVVNIKIEK